MLSNLAFRRGLWLSLFAVEVIGYLLGDWRASGIRSVGLSARQDVALRRPDLSASQTVRFRFPDLSASKTVGFRFPDLWNSTTVAARVPEPAAVGVSLARNSVEGADASASREATFHLVDSHADAALPPIGHSRFCVRYPDDCKVHEIDFRHRNITLTSERWNELRAVNRNVNRLITAAVTDGDGTTEEWRISPPTGDCKDYAITKRHELLARGWPSRSLLLSEVVIRSGEHHLFLVVRVKDADLVLDNLNDEIQLVSMIHSQYFWVRVQSPENPKFWTRLRRPDAVRTSMLLD